MWIVVILVVLLILSSSVFVIPGVRMYLHDCRIKASHRSVAAELESKLRNMQSFYTLVHGRGYHTVTECPRFYADDELTVVLKHEGRPAAVIGFHIENQSLNVTQLQGLKGACLFDLDADTWMLVQAETIARHLRLAVVRIIKAAYQDNYKDDAVTFYLRMHRRYNRTPIQKGYVSAGMWWEKQFIGGSGEAGVLV